MLMSHYKTREKSNNVLFSTGYLIIFISSFGSPLICAIGLKGSSVNIDTDAKLDFTVT